MLLLFIASSPKRASYCHFRKAVSSNFFQKILLPNFIITCVNLLQRFIQTISAEKRLWNVCSTKGAVIASFIERLKQLLEKTLLVNSISPHFKLLTHFVFARFLLIEGCGKCALCLVGDMQYIQGSSLRGSVQSWKHSYRNCPSGKCQSGIVRIPIYQ